MTFLSCLGVRTPFIQTSHSDQDFFVSQTDSYIEIQLLPTPPLCSISLSLTFPATSATFSINS